MVIEKLKHESQKKAKLFEEELKELAIISEKNLENIEYVARFNSDSKQPDEIDNDNNFLKKQNNLICKDEIEKLMKRHQHLKMDLMKLQVTTGIFDLPSLIQELKTIEESNFNRFHYINDLSDQIENMELNINELNKQKNDLLTVAEKGNINRKEYLGKKQQIINSNNVQCEEYIDRTKNIENLLKEANKEIETIFYYLECDHLVDKNIQNDNFLEIKNILLVLGLMEKKQLEILHAYSTILSTKKLEKSKNFEDNQHEENVNQEKEIKINKDLILLEKEEHPVITNKLLSYEDFKLLGMEKMEKLLVDNQKNKIRPTK